MAGLTASITEQGRRADPRIGQGIDRLDTPTLLLDTDASDRNLKRMADFFRDRPAEGKRSRAARCAEGAQSE